VIVFATSAVDISLSPSVLSLDELSPRTLQIDIADRNGNLPAAGSTVEISTSNGELLTEGNFVIGNSNARGPLRLRAQLIGDGEPSSGQLTVIVSSPSGVVSQAQLQVTDVRACDLFPVPLPPGCEGGDAAVDELTVSPAQFTVQPNDSDRVANVAAGVFAGTGSTRRAFSGVVPSVSCQPSGTASDLHVEPPQSISPTDSNGFTTLAFRLSAGPLPTGSVVCTVRAGEQSTEVRFDAAQLDVVRLDAAPDSFTVTAEQSGGSFVTQLGVFAQGAGSTLIPVQNLRPVVGACDPGTASGFFILPPTEIAPTNAQGGTTASFTVNSGGAVSGTWTCPISAGGVTLTVSFSAP
jgi:hypothetical protein